MSGQTTNIQKSGLILGIVSGMIILIFFNPDPERPQVTATAAIAILMAIWWITEAIPLAVTSLIPVVLFPVCNIMDGKAVSSAYFNDVIFLFIGGFIVALAMQRWNLHKRIALITLIIFGVRPKRILLGFMVSTAFLSMWISNTAATMMMISIALSVIINLESTLGEKPTKKYAIGLLLGTAYSASIGGIATLIGTPPNLAFLKIYTISFPEAPEISFLQWMIFALPVSVFFLFVAWGFLSLLFCRVNFFLDREIFRKQYRDLGKISYEEIIVLTDFLLLALLWLSRADIRIGNFIIPGWSGLFSNPEYINDGTVAILLSLLLFIIPAKKASSIMNWDTAVKLPWSIVLLFGGGFALATGFKESGLSEWFGSQLAGLENFPTVLIIAALAFMITFLTELTSNTATAQILLPIIGALAVSIEKNPLMLMIPATLSCSFAFMLPVATPPNAIIFGTDRLRIIDMARVGIILNLIGIVIVTIAIYLLGGFLNIDSIIPGWAK
ncbi:MAG: SLC13 family permease [Bacteroidetes bacterium]|nr:SLC13 family permease [Bacteroidota bacterium]